MGVNIPGFKKYGPWETETASKAMLKLIGSVLGYKAGETMRDHIDDIDVIISAAKVVDPVNDVIREYSKVVPDQWNHLASTGYYDGYYPGWKGLWKHFIAVLFKKPVPTAKCAYTLEMWLHRGNLVCRTVQDSDDSGVDKAYINGAEPHKDDLSISNFSFSSNH